MTFVDSSKNIPNELVDEYKNIKVQLEFEYYTNLLRTKQKNILLSAFEERVFSSHEKRQDVESVEISELTNGSDEKEYKYIEEENKYLYERGLEESFLYTREEIKEIAQKEYVTLKISVGVKVSVPDKKIGYVLVRERR